MSTKPAPDVVARAVLSQMHRRGLTVSGLARAADVDRSTLGRWLAGKSSFSSKHLDRVFAEVGLHLVAIEDLPFALPVFPPVRHRG
jgi:transcriptional regulator with XRE-family HTH domain